MDGELCELEAGVVIAEACGIGVGDYLEWRACGATHELIFALYSDHVDDLYWVGEAAKLGLSDYEVLDAIDHWITLNDYCSRREVGLSHDEILDQVSPGWADRTRIANNQLSLAIAV
jgi:hypothetical protein